MHRALPFLFSLIFAASAAAQELRQSLEPPPSGSIEVLSGGKLVMSSDICTTLAGPLVPSADYQEGIDAEGHRVAPADLPSSAPPIKVDNFPIEIKADLAGKFGVPASGGVFGAKAILGYVTLHDNRAYFNGQPMGEDQRAALVEACRDAKP